MKGAEQLEVLGRLFGKAVNTVFTIVECTLMQPAHPQLPRPSLPRPCDGADQLAEAEEEYETSPEPNPGDRREVQDTGEASAVGPTSRHPLHQVVPLNQNIQDVLKNHRLVDIMTEDDERWQRWGCFHAKETRPHQRFTFPAEWRAHVADEVVKMIFGRGSDD